MNIENNINYLDYINYLGIKKGDVLLVTSDILRIFSNEYKYTNKMPDINLFIDKLIEEVGEEGTLLFPTFNWDFCQGKVFDWAKTPGKTGSLGNACLKRKDFKRTKHALYSFAVYGKDQAKLCSIDSSDSFDSDSIFAYLDNNHAKQIMIGLDLWGFTFIHYIEQQVLENVEYRFIKAFSGEYIDEMRNKSVRTFTMLVRDLDKFKKFDLAPLEQKLIREELADKVIINGIPNTIIPNLHATVECIKNDIIYNKSRLFCIHSGQ